MEKQDFIDELTQLVEIGKRVGFSELRSSTIEAQIIDVCRRNDLKVGEAVAILSQTLLTMIRKAD